MCRRSAPRADRIADSPPRLEADDEEARYVGSGDEQHEQRPKSIHIRNGEFEYRVLQRRGFPEARSA
jgi:hypothetical protein